MKWLEPSHTDAGKLYLKTSKTPPDPFSVRWWIRLLAVPGLVLFLLVLTIEVGSLLNHWPLKTDGTPDWQAIGNQVWHLLVGGGFVLFFGFCVFRGKVPQWLCILIFHARAWRSR